jgi:rubredoxin
VSQACCGLLPTYAMIRLAALCFIACAVAEYVELKSPREPGSASTPVPTPAPADGPVIWTCQECDHVYNPQRDGGGLPFEKLPDNWKCPVCGNSKSYYRNSTDQLPVEKRLVTSSSDSWICSVCDHVREPQKDGGDQPFEQLPASWRKIASIKIASLRKAIASLRCSIALRTVACHKKTASLPALVI